MARRKTSGLDLIASLPWPVGIVLGILAYWCIRYGIGLYFTSQSGPLLKGVGKQASGGAFALLAWAALAACWIAAAASAVGRHRRKQLLESQTGLDSLRGISWREFEMLVGESFRRRGYSVEENGLGGKDGGIDLVVRKDGRNELVQCKQWKNSRVSVATVREMWGLKTHHNADGVHIVCIGDFTPDAAAFARGKPIHLTTGQSLLELIRKVQLNQPAAPTPLRTQPVVAAATDVTTCPTCGSNMVKRTNRHNGQHFMGCTQYPRCRGTLGL